ncbi:MAG: ATPase, RecA superfamily [Candidatus Parvarchaeum acidophilus ARMAN-5_'5-way FS']|jgi:circadian clock protein KaiC|uniref:ATPase, RecA superfamily n=1 Tax=Candidatus Parvarchaeum acidophilus ARMAN-5_'5-way FS' TaxID=994838 RepID=F2UU24_PARA5|nr:MAG: ATPase, RecA superfamily [Candidatus Parvarchaeum acidophilus ARMAN-5_'5-way FS']
MAQNPVIERIPSGIYGLDSKIEGGFEKGSIITVIGGPGAGKSIFSMQFIYEGLKRKEKTLYVSFEESEADLIRDMLAIELDPSEYIKNESLTILFASPINFEYLSIIDVIKSKSISRVVIDSLSAIYLNINDDSKFRKFILDLVTFLRELKVTSVLTDEQPQGDDNETKFFSGEYLSDSVIKLFYSGLGGEYDRSMQIVKMRRTNNYRSLIPMKIDKKGIFLK